MKSVILKQDECWAAAITPSNPMGRVPAGTMGEIRNHSKGEIVVFDSIPVREGCVFRVGESFDRLFGRGLS